MESLLHARTTVNLPTLAGRAAARNTLEADVQAFLKRGGKIQHIPLGQSADSIVSFAPPGADESRVRGAASTGAKKRVFWSEPMLETLRQQFRKTPDDELAAQLGVTPAHLRHKASHLGLIQKVAKGEKLKAAAAALRERWHTSSRTELAKELGLSVGTAYRMAKEMGLTNPGQRAHV